MIRTKFAAAIAMLAASALVLTGCTSDSTGEADSTEGSAGVGDHTLVFAYITAESFPYHDGAMKFKEILEGSTDGKMKVELYPAGQLGGEREINESILAGSVDIGIGAGALATLAPIMNLLEMPFMIQGQEHMHRIIESPIADELSARILEGGGFHVLDWFSTGDSSIQTVGVPITEPADMEGLKLRSIENPALADALQSLGANPTPMPYGEVYTGIQTGVIEGATLDWGSVVSMRLYELIDHATSDEAAFLAEPRPVIMSESFWNELNEAEQEAVSAAMTEAASFERELFIELQDEAVATVAEEGVEITEIDEEAFLEALQPVWKEWAAELDAEDVLQSILDLRE